MATNTTQITATSLPPPERIGQLSAPLSPRVERPATPPLIAEITNRLIDFYDPLRIYLFGSEARGDSGPDSDFDFCVLLPDDAQPQLFRDRSIHGRFWGLDASIDVLRFAESDFDKRAHYVVTSLPATIMREGRLLFDARVPKSFNKI